MQSGIEDGDDMKKSQMLRLSRIYAVAKAHLGRPLLDGESPLEIAAEVLVQRGVERPVGMSARKFLEANRAALFGSPTAAKFQAPPVKPLVATDAFLQTYEWRRVRMQAIKRYGNKCQCCGASPANGAVINVDHIKPRKLFPDLALDVSNLQVLCHECNHGKGNWDMSDWRPSSEAVSNQ